MKKYRAIYEAYDNEGSLRKVDKIIELEDDENKDEDEEYMAKYENYKSKFSVSKQAALLKNSQSNLNYSFLLLFIKIILFY